MRVLQIIGVGALRVAGAAVLGAALVASCTQQAINQVQQPPAEYHGDKLVAVHFVAPELIQQTCGQGLEQFANTTIEACTLSPGTPFQTIVMPNPFDWPASDLVTWALIFMHELGHANGWPANHPTT